MTQKNRFALRKTDEDLLDIFQRNCQRIGLVTRLTDRISNSGVYKKCGSIPLSRGDNERKVVITGHVLRMKNNRLSEIALFGPPSRAEQKPGRTRLGWEDATKKYLKEMGTSRKDAEEAIE